MTLDLGILLFSLAGALSCIGLFAAFLVALVSLALKDEL